MSEGFCKMVDPGSHRKRERQRNLMHKAAREQMENHPKQSRAKEAKIKERKGH